jgi:hypothetical protein
MALRLDDVLVAHGKVTSHDMEIDFGGDSKDGLGFDEQQALQVSRSYKEVSLTSANIA